ncbi:apolipoprotein D-like [Cyprinodon tularosa]|uniref:apolipoprotein D-like n=1 Tax=Cyprinodon tularosa TaxID=77115 RepID=UPI0018E25DF3|nr:apolipoprotein D-like [Cyprinodon tularosa]
MSPSCFVLLLLPLISAQTVRWGRCPTPPVQPDFKLQEYMGKWYEIEKIPAYFSYGKCIEANYLLRNDGTVLVRNSQVVNGTKMEVEGTAKLMDPREPAKLGVSFSRFIPYRPYWVLTTDYTNFTVVYSCTEMFGVGHIHFAWILSRSPSLPDETVQRCKEMLMREGIHVAAMKPTKQDCAPEEDHDGSGEKEN